MIDKLNVLSVIESALKGTDKYLVNLKITTDNRIFVSIDGDNGVVIDDCVDLSRKIESSLNRDEEDFELNVSSAGLDSPLRLPRQYKRHIGQDLEVTTFDGQHEEGTLTEADDRTIKLSVTTGKKKEKRIEQFGYTDIKTAKIIIKF